MASAYDLTSRASEVHLGASEASLFRIAAGSGWFKRAGGALSAAGAGTTLAPMRPVDRDQCEGHGMPPGLEQWNDSGGVGRGLEKAPGASGASEGVSRHQQKK